MARSGSGGGTFIGRRADAARLTEALDHHRLVTLTGPGGAGKTRLALEVAARGAPGDHTVAELADRTAADLPAIAEHLAATTAGLLVFDNAEHLLDELAATAAELLAADPERRLLVTSRRPLLLPGERVVALLALDPDDAVRLLADRAALVGATVADDLATRALCDHLDGLPLAIELAAAQLRDHGVAELDAALADRFRVLVRTGRGDPGPDRHRSLQAAIDDSHDRLDPDARCLLAAASVFRGWFTRTELAAVHDAADRLRDLVDASLVVADTDGPVARFRLLHSIRDYAAARLAEDEDGNAGVRTRFAEWALAVTAAHPLGTHHEAEHLTQVDAHAPNLVAALDLAPPGLDLRLAVALAASWERRAAVDDARARLERLATRAAADPTAADHALITAAWLAAGRLALRQSDLDAAEAAFTRAEDHAPDDATRAAATAGQGRVARRRGRYDLAQALLGHALKTLRRLGTDPAGVATCLTELGRLASLQGRRADATAFLSDAIAEWRELGDRRGILDATTSMAKGAEAAGDLAGAEARLREAVTESRELGDPHQIAAALANLADVRYLREGGGARYEEPERLHLEVLAIAEQIGDRRRQAAALNALGTISYRRTEFAAAIERWTRTLELSRAIGDRRVTIATLAALANVTAMAGDVEQGWVLINDALNLQRELGEPRALMHMLHPAAEIARDGAHWAEALRLAAEAERLADHAGDPLAALTARYHTAYVAIVAGDQRKGLRQAVDVATASLAHGERHLAARALEAAGLALAGEDAAATVFLFGAGEMLRGATPFTAYYRPSVRHHLDAAIARSRAELGGRFEPTWLDGHGADATAALARAEAAIAALTEPGAAARGPVRGTWRFAAGVWTVGLDGHDVAVPDSKGLRHLARLLACPGTPIAAADLAGADLTEPGLPVADAAALRAYRRSLDGRPDDLTDENRPPDDVRQAVAAATGHHGELRLERGTDERARKAVTKCIREAIARLEPAAPDLARHLQHAVKTGTWCSYEPEKPVSWSFGGG